MSRAPPAALPGRRMRWGASRRIVPADLPPLPLSTIAPEQRLLDVAALLLDDADAADAVPSHGGAPRGASTHASPETSALLAPFRYPGASRFSDGSFGLYYAARELDTAIAETVHHDARRLRDRDESVSLDKQVFIAPIVGSVRSLIGREADFPGVDSALDDDYAASRALGLALLDQSARGLVYRSVRRPAGRCVAVFDPVLVGVIVRGPRLRYHYDAAVGQIVAVDEIRSHDVPPPS